MSTSNEKELTMEERLHRLRLLLREEDAWQNSDHPSVPVIVRQPAMEYNSAKTGDDERLLPDFDRGKGALQRSIRSPEIDQEPAASSDPSPPKTEDEAPKREMFCSFEALIKYHRNHVTSAEHEATEFKFFETRQVYEYPWDFFYIYPPFDLARFPIFLVSLSQVDVFLAQINSELGTSLLIPEDAAEMGFMVEFLLDGAPYPTHVGRLTELEIAEICKMRVPSVSNAPRSELEHSDNPAVSSLETFRKKILLLLKAERRKKFKEDKSKARYQQKQSWNHTIKRVQRYLGIREARKWHEEALQNAFQGSGLERAKSEEAITDVTTKLAQQSGFDISAEAPFVQENSIVFVSIDVEAYERAHGLVTEIGVATLDTADITNIAAGQGAKKWMAAIRARHFRIKEYGHLVNKDFVLGCPDKFLFGTSEWIGIKDAPREIAKCFKQPFSKPNTEHDASLPKRNIIFVGHNVKADVNFLRQIGYDIRNLSNLQELVDTSTMYQALSRDKNPRSLGVILANLNISGWHLHNAGNDAVYTLQAMLAISVQALAAKLDHKATALEIGHRTGEVSSEGIENDLDSERAWSSTGEGSDGGYAVLTLADAPAPRKGKSKASEPIPSRSHDAKADVRNRPWRAASPVSW